MRLRRLDAGTLRDVRSHQRQLKFSQERLDGFFATLESIINNQMQIIERIDKLSD